MLTWSNGERGIAILDLGSKIRAEIIVNSKSEAIP